MFDIDLSPSYFWPVAFSLPKPDGGHQPCTFDAEFKRLDTDQIGELQKRVQAEQMSDAAIATEIVSGWRGVTDRSGSTVAYSAGALAKLLKIPGVASAVVAAFFASLLPAAEKN